MHLLRLAGWGVSPAQLAGPLDQFFSDIMVMTDDDALKDNRLALLSELQTELGRVADISLLAH